MARTALTPTVLVRDAKTVQPAGTAVDPTNGHSIVSEDNGQETFVDIDSTFSGAKTFTFKAGIFPGAAAGDLVVSLNATRAIVGPLSMSRFGQADGSINIDVQAAATGTIRAYRFPGSATT